LIERYAELSSAFERPLAPQRWRTTSEDGANNHESVCATRVVTKKMRQWYLVDVWRRIDHPSLKADAQTLRAESEGRHSGGEAVFLWGEPPGIGGELR